MQLLARATTDNATIPARVALLAGLALVAGLSGCSSCGDETGAVCRSSTECATGQVCTAAGQCVRGAECGTDDDCTVKDPRRQCNTTTNACELRPGFADECSDAKPCAFGQFCSTLLGRCLDAATARDCTRRSQCPSQQICDRQANKCVPDTGCYGAAFCEDGETCDLVSHACHVVSVQCWSCFVSGMCDSQTTCSDTKECLAAGETPKCAASEKCDPLGRCIQCATTADCGPGLFCDVGQGKCESRVQCADDPSLCPDTPDVQCVMCTAPEVCDMRTRKCTAPATVCASDVDCPGDKYCNLALDPPVCELRIPDCLNDRYEDQHRNEHYYDASPLAASDGPTYDELKLCPGDEDWYTLDVAAGTYLTIDARFRESDGDIDLQLFLADGTTLLTESRGSNDNERVALEVGTELHLLLRVFLALPSVNAVPYKLVVTRDMGDLCPDDANEPDDLAAEAKPLESDTPHEGRLCTGDPDWYVLRQVAAGTRIVATLDFTSHLGNLDLELYRSGANTPLLRSAGNTDEERIVYDASYPGDYYLRVVAKSADTNVYTIRANLRPGEGSVCLDDQYEPNDIPGQATSATPFLGAPVPSLAICTGDEDWFSVDLGPGEGLTAEIGFNPPADLELGLYPGGISSPEAGALRSSKGRTPREFLGYRAAVAGNYLVRVFGHDGAQISPYELRLNRLPPLVECVPDMVDALARGQTQADAWDLPIAPTRADSMTLCPGDQDWYRIYLMGGFVNVVRLQYLEADGALDLGLFDGAGNQLIMLTGTGTDYKEVQVPVLGQGIAVAYLSVSSTAVLVGNTYSLAIDLIPSFNCFPDYAEPDDAIVQPSLAASSTITPIALPNLTLCPASPNSFTGGGDEDYFLINPPRAGVRIEASIDFPQGDLFLELLNPLGNARACLNTETEKCYSDSFDLTESVTFTATVARPYYLHVGSIYSFPGVPGRPADADTSYNLQLRYVTP